MIGRLDTDWIHCGECGKVLANKDFNRESTENKNFCNGECKTKNKMKTIAIDGVVYDLIPRKFKEESNLYVGRYYQIGRFEALTNEDNEFMFVNVFNDARCEGESDCWDNSDFLLVIKLTLECSEYCPSAEVVAELSKLPPPDRRDLLALINRLIQDKVI